MRNQHRVIIDDLTKKKKIKFAGFLFTYFILYEDKKDFLNLTQDEKYENNIEMKFVQI